MTYVRMFLSEIAEADSQVCYIIWIDFCVSGRLCIYLYQGFLGLSLFQHYLIFYVAQILLKKTQSFWYQYWLAS